MEGGTPGLGPVTLRRVARRRARRRAERDTAPPPVLPWVAELQDDLTAAHLTPAQRDFERQLALRSEELKESALLSRSAPLPGYVPLATCDDYIDEQHVFEVTFHNGEGWETGECRGGGTFDRTAVVVCEDGERRLYRKEALFLDITKLDGHVKTIKRETKARGLRGQQTLRRNLRLGGKSGQGTT